MRDTQTLASVGQERAADLLAQHDTRLLLIADSSPNTSAVVDALDATDSVLVISACGTAVPASASYQANAKNLFFRTAGASSLIAEGAAHFIKADGKHDVGLLVDGTDLTKTPYTIRIGDGFAAAFAQGGDTVNRVNFDGLAPAFGARTSDYNFSGDLAAAAAGGTDAIFIASYEQAGLGILSAWIASNKAFQGQWYLNEPNRNPGLVSNLTTANTNGIRGFILGTSPRRSLVENAFVAEYGRTYGDPGIPRIAETYDAVYLLGLAIAKAGTTEAAAVRDALWAVNDPEGTVVGPGEFKTALDLIAAGQKINYEGASGSVNFDTHGGVQSVLGEWVLQDGVFTTTAFYP
jgi:branched-chain amino acid transport system substrate-binding protein